MNGHTARTTAVLAAVTLLTAVAPARADTNAGVSAHQSRSLVVRYFRALGAHRFDDACAMLGSQLKAESGGEACSSFLRRGMPAPLKYEIGRTRIVRGGIGVLVALGQNELDHVRMRTWLAVVRVEGGVPRIVATRLLA